MTHVAANVINDAYRYYDDDVSGAITAQTALAAVDTDISINADTKFHVALLATETAGGDANNLAFSVEYRKNGGTWTDLTTTTTDVVYAVTADNCTTADNASYGTTALTTGATIQGTEYCNNADAAGSVSLNSASFEKTTCVIIPTTNNSNGDTFEFRLTDNGSALDADTTIGTVTVVIPIALDATNISSASTVSSPSITQDHAIGAATGASSATQVSSPTLVEDPAQKDLLANDVQSASNVSSPSIGQTHAIGAATGPQSASNVSSPAAVITRVLDATNVQSASTTSSPSIGQTHAIGAATGAQSASNVGAPALAEDIEILSPDGDDSIGSWTNELGGTTNIYTSIDETPFSDADYVRSELNPTTSVARFTLANPGGAVDVASAHKIQYRYYKEDANGQQIDLVVRLKQGAGTTIATWTHTNITGTVVQAIQTLNGSQVANITDYNDLRLEFEANAP